MSVSHVSDKLNYTKNERKKEKKVVSSRVERLVYTEAVESSNPSLPIEKNLYGLGSSGGRVPG